MKRFATFLLATTLAFSSLSVNAMAAPSITSYSDEAVVILREISKYPAVEKALNAIELANKSGRAEDVNAATVLINSLSRDDRIRLYIILSRKNYEKHLKAKDYRFFDPAKYLFTYTDVEKEARTSGATDLYEFALWHYLTYGVYEGRSSQTSFDPVVAITKQPQILSGVLISAADQPEGVYAAFVKVTGKTTTSQTAVTEPASSGSGDETTESSSDEPTPEPAPEPTPGPVSYINRQTKDITPYDLFAENIYANSVFSFTTSDVYGPENNKNKNVDVYYLGKNYEKVHELAKDKKYTLMIYMCGTDQEMKDYYRRVSMQLCSLVKGEMNNVNVLVCLGGTNSYVTEYLNKGCSYLRTGIYYVNPDGLTNDAKELLKDFKLDTATLNTYSNGKKFDEIITEDTFVKLTGTTSINMGDPSLLAGFINFGTELFPATAYGVSLSDHGGGIEEGVCFSDHRTDDKGTKVIEGTSLETQMLESAFAATNLFGNRSKKDDGRLNLLFMDACLQGSTELANNLRNYYRYMMASEEMTVSWTDYAELVTKLNQDVKNKAADQKVAIDLAKTFQESDWHHGENDGLIGSIAVFSADAMEDTYNKVNDLADSLTDILTGQKYSDEFREKIFLEVRKSALSCYLAAGNTQNDNIRELIETNNYVDIGEFMTLLYKNISKLKSSASGLSKDEKKALEKVVNRTEGVLDSGFMAYLSIDNYKGTAGYYWENEESIVAIKELQNLDVPSWTDIRGKKDYLYGSSLYLPMGMKHQSFKDSIYYSFYKDSELDPYVTFLDEYLKYYNDTQSGYGQKRAELAKELKDDFSKLITASTDVTDIVDDSGEHLRFVTFEIAESYEAAHLCPPQNTTGSPMQDILETQSTIEVAAVHKQYFPTKDGKSLVVDMICAEDEVSRYGYALGSNKIYFNVTDLEHSVIQGYSMYGKLYDPETGGAKQDTDKKDIKDWQYVLKSMAEGNNDMKLSIVKAVAPQVPDTEGLFTVYGGAATGTFTEDSFTPGAPVVDVYHVFMNSEGNENTYNYVGSASYNEKEKSASVIQNVTGISVCHYILYDEPVKGEDGNPVIGEDGKIVTVTTKAILENFDGINDGYFSCDFSDKGSSLAIAKASITEPSQEGGKATSIGTGYVLDIGGTYADYTKIAGQGKHYDSLTSAANGPLTVADSTAIDAKIKDKIAPGWSDDKEDDYGPVPYDDDDVIINMNKAKQSAAENEKETESEGVAEAETEVEAEAVAETEITTEAETENEAEAVAETEIGAVAETTEEPEKEAEAVAETEIEAVAEATEEPEKEAETSAETEASSETEAAAETETEQEEETN